MADLIMLFSTAVVLSMVNLFVNGDSSRNMEEAKHVVVVGGGIAGLAAARTLLNSGYSVNVLEARRERYGGRIFTDRKSLNKPRGISGNLMHF